MADKLVYSFADGRAEGHGGMRALLGQKGAILADLTRSGLPVPPGFTITTEACRRYLRRNGEFPDGLPEEVEAHVGALERARSQGFGDPAHPLLVSVRPGARVSLPGGMGAVLNLGLDERTVEGLGRWAGNRRFALDCYRRFLQGFGDAVLGIAGEEYEAILAGRRKSRGLREEDDLEETDLEFLVEEFRTLTEQISRRDFPREPFEQLREALGAAFQSWNDPQAASYRRDHGIPADEGTAVTVQAMVFGNRGERSATGLAFLRDPAGGEKGFSGEYLVNAQGDDLEGGKRAPAPLERSSTPDGCSLEERMPDSHALLKTMVERLEGRHRDLRGLEFTIEEGRVFILGARSGD